MTGAEPPGKPRRLRRPQPNRLAGRLKSGARSNDLIDCDSSLFESCGGIPFQTDTRRHGLRSGWQYAGCTNRTTDAADRSLPTLLKALQHNPSTADPGSRGYGQTPYGR